MERVWRFTECGWSYGVCVHSEGDAFRRRCILKAMHSEDSGGVNTADNDSYVLLSRTNKAARWRQDSGKMYKE